MLFRSYQPLTPERWRGIVGESVNIEAQLRAQPELAPDIERFRARFLANSNRTMESLAFYPAVLRYGVVMFALDRETGRLFGWMSE